MNEDHAMLNALQRLYIMHERALRTSVGHPHGADRDIEFRNALIDFIAELGLDPDTTDILIKAARSPTIPQGDAVWDD